MGHRWNLGCNPEALLDRRQGQRMHTQDRCIHMLEQSDIVLA